MQGEYLQDKHCELDGTTILAFTDALLSAVPDAGVRRYLPPVAPVRFGLDDGLRSKVCSAAAYVDATATQTVSFDDFGSSAAKALGVSPDAFVQIAYHLAHQRAKSHLGTTYESIARQFRHGRTEAMHVVTPEMRELLAEGQRTTATRGTPVPGR